MPELGADRNAENRSDDGAAHDGGEPHGAFARRRHAGRKRRHDRPEDGVREGNAHARCIEGRKAVDEDHRKVAAGEDDEEKEQKLSAFELRGRERERKRHDRHHPRVARNHEPHEGNRLIEALRHIGEKTDRKKFRRIEDEGGKGEADDGKPGAKA